MQLIENITGQKLRGGFYTPPIIAEFILRWAINGRTDASILEPSCGDGVFLEQIKNHGLKYASLTGVELDKYEANKAKKIGLPNSKIINNDFHKYCNSTKGRFDLIVGNPPYIRYQYFDEEQQVQAAKIFNKAGINHSKLSNAWVSFVLGSSLLLKDEGKIGFVLPAEILQVSFAKELRSFLAHFYNKINIISFKQLVFPEVQQEIVLLLCEKNQSNSHLIEHLELTDTSDLKSINYAKLHSPVKRIDFKSNKWTFYFLNQSEINFIEKVAEKYSIPRLGDLADVEIGITTGSNEFFTVPHSIVARYNLEDYAERVVGRSVQVSSIIFDNNDWRKNKESEARAYLLRFPEKKFLRKNRAALSYLALGEKNKIHHGYKCQIRDEWQIVPSAWIPDLLFVRRNHLYPKLVINSAKAFTTDTMHRVRLKKKVNAAAFAASYYNSLSLAFSELCGRSHGGGVLELMPNETESILLPFNNKNANLTKKIDVMMRKGVGIDKILAMTDKIILEKNYGLSQSEIKLANKIWKKLLARRLVRGSKVVSELIDESAL